MSDAQITALGASAPSGFIAIPDGLVVELETKLDLTEDQRQKALYAKRMKILHGLTGVARARAMRDVRESLERNSSGQNGWDSLCRSDFDTNANDANLEIRGLEAFEAAFSDGSGVGSSTPIIPAEVGSSHLNEVGRVSDVASRMTLAVLVRDAEIKLSCSKLRAKAKELKKKAGTTLQVSKPKEPSKSPLKLPAPDPNATGGPTISRSKYGDLPERAQEFKYLKGRDAANDKLAEDLTKLLRSASSSGSGKLARLRVLSEALHREFKSIGDRYHGKWDKASHYPRYMTLWQQLWIEEGSLTLHEELNGIRREIAEANRYSSIANMHLHVDDLEMTD